MTMQHVIHDAFSLEMLFDELQQDYFGDELPSRPQPAIHRFIQCITGVDKTAALEFWTPYLAGAVTKPLPTFPPGVKLFDLDIEEVSVTAKMPELRAPEATIAYYHALPCIPGIIQRLGTHQTVGNQ
jgi:hypothetical protein